MTLAEAKDRFLYEKQLKNCSQETVKSYHYFIKVFLDFVGICELSALTMADVERYALHLYGSELSSATHHTYLHHLRIFLTW